MASAAILGMPAETCSSSFFMVFVNAALAYALLESKKRSIDQTTEKEKVDDYDNLPGDLTEFEDSMDHDTSNEEDPLADYLDNTEPAFFGQDEDRSQEDQSHGYSTASVYTVNKRKIAFPQHIHYAF